MPAPGVPLSVPVPLPLSTNVTPAGSATPPIVRAAAGNPLVVTVKDPSVPTVNVVLAALVIAGAWLTFSVKACVPSGSTPFAAVKVSAYVPPVPPAGVPLKRAGAVAVVHERHARGQRPAHRRAPASGSRWSSR